MSLTFPIAPIDAHAIACNAVIRGAFDQLMKSPEMAACLFAGVPLDFEHVTNTDGSLTITATTQYPVGFHRDEHGKIIQVIVKQPEAAR